MLRFLNAFIVFLLSSLWLSPSFANSEKLLAALRGDHTYEAYYTISILAKANKLSLLAWTFHSDPQYQAPETYQRTKHFRGWIIDPSQNTCFNVRNLVLHRNALQPITLDPKNNCRIQSSSWYDPYSDEYFLRANELQIDHVVPLKNAYLAGAWNWDTAKRCHYENFLEDSTHLIPVEKTANLSKGERGPESYMPINTRFHCNYLAMWLRIKALWHLKIATLEADGIRAFINENACPTDLFEMNLQDYQRLEKKTQEPPEVCYNL